MEQLANNPVTTLSGSINSSVTSLTVASGSAFPTTGDFTVKIGTELIRVTGVSGTTWTVARGQEGTTAASHSASDTVTQVVTANVVSRLLTEMFQTGLATSRPATAREGTEYHATDANLGWRYNGSTGWDLIRPLYVPYANRVNVTGWTDYNNTGLTWTDYGGVYLNSLVGAAGVNIRGKYHTKPSAPFTLTAVVAHSPLLQLSWGIGLGLFDPGTSKLKNFMLNSYDNLSRMIVQNYNSPTSYNADLTDNNKIITPAPYLHLRLIDDNTNWLYQVSFDGVDYVQIHSETRNTFLTPTHVGFTFYKDNNYYGTAAMPSAIYAYWEA